MNEAHLRHSCRLCTFVHCVHFSTAVSLVVTDISGHLSGFELLEVIPLTAKPAVDVLLMHRKDSKKRNRGCGETLQQSALPSRCTALLVAHLSQVNDEAVSFVEAVPGQLHLRGSDGSTAFQVQQAFNSYVIGYHMFEA